MPRPSRDSLDAADLALEQAIAEQQAAVAAIDEQIETMRKQRCLLEEKHQQERSKLEKQAGRERSLYDAALERWRVKVARPQKRAAEATPLFSSPLLCCN